METILEFRECGTAWPYPSQPKNPNYRHDPIDLRKEPDGVFELPEVKRSPGFALFLQMLNSRHGIFRTLGCDYDEGADPNLGLNVWSYAHIAFAEDAPCATLDNYAIVFARLAQHLHANMTDVQASVVASMEKFDIDGKEIGWTMSLNVTVRRPTIDEARQAWLDILNSLWQFLVNFKLPEVSGPDAK